MSDSNDKSTNAVEDKRLQAQELIVCFTENGFILDFEQVVTKKQQPDVAQKEVIERELYKKYRDDSSNMLFDFAFTEANNTMASSLAFLHSVAVQFIQSVSRTEDIEFTRENTEVIPAEEDIVNILQSVPFVTGLEFVNENWVKQVYRSLSAVFTNQIRNYSGSVADFLVEHNTNLHVAGRIFFHLVENKSDEYPFAFLATYSTGKLIQNKASHMPLENALIEYRGNNEKLLSLLSTVSKVAQKSDFISELVESGELFSPLQFTAREAYIFLQEIALYEECGILCRIPDWWKKKSNALKLVLKVGDKEPSKLGMEALLSFNAEIYFGENKFTENDCKMLLAETNGLAFIKGKWIEVDQKKLQATLAAYEQARKLAEKGNYTIAEAIRLQLNATAALNIDEGEVQLDVSNGEWLDGVTSKLSNTALLESVSPGENFQAVLRSYQQQGFDWLNYLQTLGFGACLADDMGLGKTVQVIALLEYLREKREGRHKTLLIMPASLIGNWQKELEKFAPKLTYKIITGGKTKDSLPISEGKSGDVYITTYGMAVRLAELQAVPWDLVILDEAQAIKNPGTKQTKIIKMIKAKAKIAMTGTPVENSLSDLWSLFDFLNPGLLGTAKEFTGFHKKLREMSAGYATLRKVVNPFILRRLKTDKTIIEDLPDKVEINVYATLNTKQAVLYNGLVKEIRQQLEMAEGIGRRGLILASIMKFKQICNHPDQFLGQTKYTPEHSGKFARLFDICETIHKKRERVLVFTQFKEMTEPLADFLESIFKKPGLVLHGGTPVHKRTELVDKFCGEEYVPFMVLSLKAGGVGLNLTAANHVIHFDRWWNPAVETQATDRAFRIGQQKNVMVHKFITTGTIEEKINSMIEDKSRLADDILAASGEKWITEMDNGQLMQLFTLVQAGEK